MPVATFQVRAATLNIINNIEKLLYITVVSVRDTAAVKSTTAADVFFGRWSCVLSPVRV